MRSFIFIFLLIFTSLTYSQEKVIFDNKLCFYNDKNKQEPARFVYYNKKTDNYVFSFVEENEKERMLEKIKNNTITKDGVKYSIGRIITTTKLVDYYEICLIKYSQ